MNDKKHEGPEVLPLHQREIEKHTKKHPTLERTPLDTTPEKHIFYASESHHARTRQNKLASLTWILLLIILFLTFASIFTASFFSMWISNKYVQLLPYDNISPTPQSYKAIPTVNEKVTSVTPVYFSQTEKELIDIWLSDNKKTFNNFGDPIDMTYTGGTPLFDERSGKTIDRYDYIVENHPDRPWMK